MALPAILASFFSTIGANILKGIKNKLMPLISSITALISMWVFHSVVDSFPRQVEAMEDLMTKSFYTPPQEWRGFVQGYISSMKGMPYEFPHWRDMKVADYARISVQELGSTFFNDMFQLIMPTPKTGIGELAITPDDGLHAAEAYLGVNMQFQMNAWLLHMLGDVQSFGVFKSFKDLPNAISWSFGLGWLSWLVMGVPFRKGIADPLEIKYNQIYRPTKPTFSQLVKFNSSRKITHLDFTTELANLGYDNKWIPMLQALDRKKLTDTQMELLLETGNLTEEAAKEDLIADGYDPILAQLIVHALAHKDTDALYRKMADEAERHYLNDLMSVGALKSFYRAADYRTEQQELMITILDMQKARLVNPTADTRNLSPANIGALYRGGDIDYRTAETMLIQTNFNPGQVDLFLSLYTPAEVKVVPSAEVTRDVVGTLFVAGKATEAELRAELKKLKYSDSAIEWFVRYYRNRIKPEVITEKITKLTPSQIGNLFKKGIVGLNEAAQRLLDLQMAESDIAYFLALYEPAEEATPDIIEKQLTGSQIGRLYEIGELDFMEALARLAALGLSELDGGLLLKLYTPTP